MGKTVIKKCIDCGKDYQVDYYYRKYRKSGSFLDWANVDHKCRRFLEDYLCTVCVEKEMAIDYKHGSQAKI